MGLCLGRCLFSGFLCCGSLNLGLGSFLLGRRSVLASLACALGFVLHCSGFSLLLGSLLVGLLYLALLKSFSDGGAASVEHYLDAVLSVVVGRYYEVDVARV